MDKKLKWIVVITIVIALVTMSCGKYSSTTAAGLDLFNTWLCENFGGRYCNDGNKKAEVEPVELPDEEDYEEDESAYEIGEVLPADEPVAGVVKVTLFPIDVRTLETKPEIIAYANVEYTSPPANVIIKHYGSLWTYNANIALMQKGDWISATCTDDNITAVGVHLGGDVNDGWARVLVDGAEVWRGSIYGDSKSPAGLWTNYLEVSGLLPGVHTIRIESLGIPGEGGGIDVAMRFFGFSTKAIISP
ncbi:MAG: hypothetical protein IH593_14510 [Bacteroidales bacterium]|nr:hypothetical protein [Bacteroidales bacterium]